MSNSNKDIIIIPGMFDHLSESPLQTVSQRLTENGFTVHTFQYSTDIHPSTFKSVLSNLSMKIDAISHTGSRPIIIGHSFGAFLGLLTNKKCRASICLDISLHPLQMFSTIVCRDGRCSWPTTIHSLPETLVKSANELQSVTEIMNSVTSKIYFIGACLAGAKISKQYYDLNPSISEYIEYPTDHNFKGYENQVSDFILKQTGLS